MYVNKLLFNVPNSVTKAIGTVIIMSYVVTRLIIVIMENYDQ